MTSNWKSLIDSQGQHLADALDVPFIHGGTTRKLEKIHENEVCVVSKVADRGVSLRDLRLVIEVAFAGKSREQNAQRVGRLLHGEFEGEFYTLFTPEELAKYRGRIFGVEAELAGAVDIEFIQVGNVKPEKERPIHVKPAIKKTDTEPKDEISQTLSLPSIAAKVGLAQRGVDSRIASYIPKLLRWCWSVALSPRELMEGRGLTGKNTLARIAGACKAARAQGLMVNIGERYQVDQAEIRRLMALNDIGK